jgi:hypothetical protein
MNRTENNTNGKASAEANMDEQDRLYVELEINCKGDRVNTTEGEYCGWVRANGSKVDAYRKTAFGAEFVGTFEHEGAAVTALRGW